MPQTATNAQFLTIFRRLVAIGDEVVDGLAALDPPQARAKPHAEMLASSRRALEMIRGVLKRIERGADAGKAIAAADAQVTKATQEAECAYRRAGLTGCAG